MFNAKNKSDMLPEKSTAGNGTTLIGAGTTVKGDISSNSDLRIDGTIVGNIHSSAKVIIGANGAVEGDINGNQADIIGKVSGNIKVKDLLQLHSKWQPVCPPPAGRAFGYLQRAMPYGSGRNRKGSKQPERA